MTTKVIFNVDKKVKEKAMKVAKAQGITISDFLSMSLGEFARGKRSIGIVEQINDKTLRSIKRAVLDAKAGRNISPAFTNTEDALKWLHS